MSECNLFYKLLLVIQRIIGDSGAWNHITNVEQKTSKTILRCNKLFKSHDIERKIHWMYFWSICPPYRFDTSSLTMTAEEQ